MSHIVVGIDGSPAGDAALLWSLLEASRRGAQVRAVTAWQPSDYAWYGAGLSERNLSDESTRSALEAAVARVRKQAGLDGVEVETVVETGPAALVLEQQAQDAELLVVGRRHESAVARAALGSVSSAALHHAPCPITVVPAGWSLPAGRSRVVVGVDGSTSATEALSWSAQRAVRDDRVLVPTRVRSAFEDAVSAPEGIPSIGELEGAEIARLTSLAKQAVGSADLTVDAEIRVGHAGRELVAATGPGDELVVGSRSRGRLRGWLLGSTSTYVVHHAHVPVIVIRETDSTA